MASLWESLSSLFSSSSTPRTSSHQRTSSHRRISSHRRTSSLFSSAFFSRSIENTTPPSTDDNNLPMPPTTAVNAAATGEGASPADSATPSPVAAGEDGYFPATTERTLSMLSTSTEDTTASATPSDMNQPAQTAAAGSGADDARPAAPRRSATFVVAHDPLSRDYPKPTHEPGLEELLARTPGRWSLSHYVKNAPVTGVFEVEAAERARNFEQVKRDLVKAKERFDGVGKV